MGYWLLHECADSMPCCKHILPFLLPSITDHAVSNWWDREIVFHSTLFNQTMSRSVGHQPAVTLIWVYEGAVTFQSKRNLGMCIHLSMPPLPVLMALGEVSQNQRSRRSLTATLKTFLLSSVLIWYPPPSLILRVLQWREAAPSSLSRISMTICTIVVVIITLVGGLQCQASCCNFSPTTTSALIITDIKKWPMLGFIHVVHVLLHDF